MVVEEEGVRKLRKGGGVFLRDAVKRFKRASKLFHPKEATGKRNRVAGGKNIQKNQRGRGGPGNLGLAMGNMVEMKRRKRGGGRRKERREVWKGSRGTKVL